MHPATTVAVTENYESILLQLSSQHGTEPVAVTVINRLDDWPIWEQMALECGPRHSLPGGGGEIATAPPEVKRVVPRSPLHANTPYMGARFLFLITSLSLSGEGAANDMFYSGWLSCISWLICLSLRSL